MSDVKYLADGTPVLVTGAAPDRTDIIDNSTHNQVAVFRLDPTELHDDSALFDTKPEPAPVAADGQQASTVPAAAATPDKATQLEALHTQGVLSDDEYEAAKARL